ncbi:hypothetical protein K9M18_00220 [Candidatus Woesearchaeota archaeon]|nr:hypothetical protein [Candidatus Woesearchaeota archaeon]MCF8012951.1 hypothetical protein [Candidatus Woesearchaeota archaeon]
MSKDNRINMPSSGAGLTKYFSDYQSKVLITPQTTLFAIMFVVLLVLIVSGKIF